MNRTAYQHLDNVPVEKLELSVVAYNCLKRMGIVSIGDVLDIYNRGGNIGCVQAPCVSKLVGEIKETLQEQGYWSLLPDESRTW